MTQTKVCTKCEEEKPLEEFHKKKSSKDGHRTQCKECKNEAGRKYHKENRDQISKKWKTKYQENKGKESERKKKYRQENKEHVLEIEKKYREDKGENLKDYLKEYREENKEQIKEQGKEYREENKEQIKENNKRYYEENKEQIKVQRRTYQRDKRKNDPLYRITQSLRGRVGSAIKKAWGTKSTRTLELLGCDIDAVRDHLEKQFQEGMSWDNYGEWHIDHILPCASFDLTDPEQQKKCFNYTNLQPLWAKDNLSKGATILTENLFTD
jgi:hypothetical protein